MINKQIVVCYGYNPPLASFLHIPSCNERYSDELEASIAMFSAKKEGDVASSSSLFVSNIRLVDRHLFVADEALPFASPLHSSCCNERIQQRVGSMNRCVFSYKIGWLCLTALSASKQQKIGKQVFVCHKYRAPVRIPLHVMSCNECFQRRSGSINQHVSTCTKGRRFPVALCATNQRRNLKQIIHFHV